MGKESRLMPDSLHQVFIISNTLIYMLCKPLLKILAVPYEYLVPEHTQYALFQLYCDLRANPIKDRHWFEVHGRRLKPHTFPGWIALGAAVLYVGSGAAASICLLLSLLAGAIYVSVFLLASAGVLAGFVTGLLAFSFFATACFAAFAATTATFGYCAVESSQQTLRFLSKHLLPQPRSIFDDIPEPPTLRPVATPRAPVLPDPSPAVNPASPQDFAPSPASSDSVSVAQVYTPEALDPIVEDAQLEAAVAEQVAKAQANAESIKVDTAPRSGLTASAPPFSPPQDASLTIKLNGSSSGCGGSATTKSPKQDARPRGNGRAPMAASH